MSPQQPPSARLLSLGERILQARMGLALNTRNKVSQEHLGALVAKQLGKPQPITGATVSRWEGNSATPDLATLWAIATVCGVDPSWLVVGPPTPPEQNSPQSLASILSQSQTNQPKAQSVAAILREYQTDVINTALKSTHETRSALLAELRLRIEENSPQAQRRRQEIMQELDKPTAIELLVRDLFTSG